jgi:hypothetical protein
MSDTYFANTSMTSDPRLMKLKEYLVNTVAPEMQNQSTLNQTGRT